MTSPLRPKVDAKLGIKRANKESKKPKSRTSKSPSKKQISATQKEKWQKFKKDSDSALEQKMLKDWFNSDKPTKKIRTPRHVKTTVNGKVVRLKGKEIKKK